ncbi:dihydrolipoyl dehydrogenase [Gracilibacillus phocaeensis]|uniref:dihydrolipoyl dehydrogenase n=1 Tax=Gracilibacillus phocaeensis TaxID=2042304 RepID=UPI00102F6B27|nr:dihydrolipoyl dehydrogenase [Gracilibacillus phocaeensis]
MAMNYDLVVVGGGTGGYIAAIHAAQAGLKTAIVEKDKLGGTCLHKGCIPTKALLKSAAVYQQVKHAETYGVETGETSFHLETAMKRKNQVVATLYNGVQQLISSHKIDLYNGYGRILGPSIFSPMAGSISVEYEDDRENDILVPKNVLLATGSSPSSLSLVEVDHHLIVTSDDLVHLEQLPESIVIVGGGVIGIEWASFLHDVGVEVSVIEAQEQILPGFDQDIVKQVRQDLQKKGIHIYEQTLLKKVEADQDVTVTYQLTDKQESISADKLLLAVGRKANTHKIGVENTDMEMDAHGFIQVNNHFQTKEDHIYAIGDMIGGKQLAHVATYEGKKAVDHMIGVNSSSLTEQEMPSCVYSNPEIATIGLTEQAVQAKGLDYSVAKVSGLAIGKAHVNGNTNGFTKIITDNKTNDVLGIHMVGDQVTELIGQASTAKYFDSSVLELSEVIYPHPSLSEMIGEAALAAERRN